MAKKEDIKNDKEKAKSSPRKIIVRDEERAKRGQWVVFALFFLSLLFSYYFWSLQTN